MKKAAGANSPGGHHWKPRVNEILPAAPDRSPLVSDLPGAGMNNLQFFLW